MCKRAFVTAATAAVVFASAGGATAAPVPDFGNGGFEEPIVPADYFKRIATGASIGPWQVTSGAVEVVDDGFWQAAEGQQSVDLNPPPDVAGPGMVAQTFTTIPGDPYTVTYSLAGNPDGPPAVKTGRVLIDGEVIQDFRFDVSGKTRRNMGYEEWRVSFVANNSTTMLSFTSTTPHTRYGPVIDNVRVNSCGC
jgi:choice-of-anchor C domain-containing protein